MSYCTHRFSRPFLVEAFHYLVSSFIFISDLIFLVAATKFSLKETPCELANVFSLSNDCKIPLNICNCSYSIFEHLWLHLELIVVRSMIKFQTWRALNLSAW